jgi:pyruvate ferredoxin oxidoreductase beta subunit
VETGIFDLYEIEYGNFRLTGASAKLIEKRKLRPASEYFRDQSRFKTMSDDLIKKDSRTSKCPMGSIF